MSIALTTHKVAAAAVGVAMVFSFAFVTPAQAQTVEELTAQINSLLSTISSLQAQLAGMTGGTTGGSSACYNFTLSHKMGDQGGEVMNLQKFLNAQGNLVATTGAGSPGNETSYFGARTKAAVVAWQNANAAAVLAPVGLTAGTGFWGPSSRAHANSMGCTTTPGTGTGTTVPTGTGLTVAAATQPANSLAPTNAANVPFTKFTLTNNSGTAQTVTGVTVQLGGLADKAAFSSVTLLDENGNQMGNTRVLNSNDQATVGSTVTIQPGQTRTFTVAGNIGTIGTTYAGQVATMSVISVNTSATVSGSLPITGASHTLNGSLSIGSVTAADGVNDVTATSTEEIGTTDHVFASVRLTNNGSTENVRWYSIRFDQAGSASQGDIVNVMGYVDGVAYTPTIEGDYYTFNFGSGIVIEEGKNKEIVVKGDIANGTNRTIKFNVHKFTDINVKGETYGYGVTPTAGTGFGSASPVQVGDTITISAGTFNSVSKSNAAPAANIAEQKSDELLGAFTVDIKGEGITVGTLTMVASTTGGVLGTDIDNVTLVDQNGNILAGPVDGTGDATGDLSFSSVSFPSGVTTVFVKGTLDSSWSNGDTITMQTTPSNWSDVTGDSTGDSISLPSSTASANTMTVQAATLSVNTLTQPAARSVVAGAIDFIFATVSLDAANSGEDIRVTALVLEDTLGDAGDNAGDIDNVEIWANLSGGSTNDSVRGDKYETRVSDAKQFSDSGATDETLSITLQKSITIAKNTSVEIAVVADLASGATAGDTHTISVDTDASDVTATGVTSGTSISSSITPSGSGQTMTVSAGGTLTVTVDSSSPVASLLLDNTTTEQTVGVFRLAASNVEDLDVDSIKITDIGTTTNSGEPVSKYVFYRGSTKLGEAVPTSGAAEVFLADGTLTVPADNYVLVTVKAVANNIVSNGVVNGDSVRVSIAAAGDVDTTGKDSGSAVDSTDTAVEAVAHKLYEAYPTFAFNNTGVSTVLTPSTNYLAGKIVISNPGDKDVTFDSSGEITLQVEISGDVLTGTTDRVTLQKADGTTLDTVNITATTGSAEAVIVFADNTLTIPAGGSETVNVIVNAAGLDTDGSTLQVWLSDDTDDNIEFAINAGATDYSDAVEIFRGDIYGPTHVNP